MSQENKTIMDMEIEEKKKENGAERYKRYVDVYQNMCKNEKDRGEEKV